MSVEKIFKLLVSEKMPELDLSNDEFKLFEVDQLQLVRGGVFSVEPWIEYLLGKVYSRYYYLRFSEKDVMLFFRSVWWAWPNGHYAFLKVSYGAKNVFDKLLDTMDSNYWRKQTYGNSGIIYDIVWKKQVREFYLKGFELTLTHFPELLRIDAIKELVEFLQYLTIVDNSIPAEVKI